jgi:hypothetical protein
VIDGQKQFVAVLSCPEGGLPALPVTFGEPAASRFRAFVEPDHLEIIEFATPGIDQSRGALLRAPDDQESWLNVKIGSESHGVGDVPRGKRPIAGLIEGMTQPKNESEVVIDDNYVTLHVSPREHASNQNVSY